MQALGGCPEGVWLIAYRNDYEDFQNMTQPAHILWAMNLLIENSKKNSRTGHPF